MLLCYLIVHILYDLSVKPATLPSEFDLTISACEVSTRSLVRAVQPGGHFVKSQQLIHSDLRVRQFHILFIVNMFSCFVCLFPHYLVRFVVHVNCSFRTSL